MRSAICVALAIAALTFTACSSDGGGAGGSDTGVSPALDGGSKTDADEAFLAAIQGRNVSPVTGGVGARAAALAELVETGAFVAAAA